MREYSTDQIATGLPATTAMSLIVATALTQMQMTVASSVIRRAAVERWTRGNLSIVVSVLSAVAILIAIGFIHVIENTKNRSIGPPG